MTQLRKTALFCPVSYKLGKHLNRRRECTDHLIAFNAEHLRRILAKYAIYYNEVRTHVSLGKGRFPPTTEPTNIARARPYMLRCAGLRWWRRKPLQPKKGSNHVSQEAAIKQDS